MEPMGYGFQVVCHQELRDSFWDPGFKVDLLRNNMEVGIPSLKLTAHTEKWMVGRRLFPFGARPIFQGGTVSFRECVCEKNQHDLLYICLDLHVWCLEQNKTCSSNAGEKGDLP